MNLYGLHGKLKAAAGKTDQLLEILIEASKLVSKVQGCQLYLVSIDVIDSNVIWVTELWDSKSDHESSLAVAEVKQLITQAIPLLDGMPDKGQVLDVVGGHGVK